MELTGKYGTITLLFAGAIAAASRLRTHYVIDAMVDALILLAAAAVVVGWPILCGARKQQLGRLIALVGCDGSGKSTLSKDLLHILSRDQNVALYYLGLGSGAIGNRIKRLPLIGPAVGRKIDRKAGQTRSKGQKIPGLLTALVVYGFSLIRLHRFRKMLAMLEAGVTVITDRYPQIEIPGFYDGPGLSAAFTRSWIIAALARKEREMYEWMASFHPDIVIRLNIDAATAHARKPDHDLALLSRKAAVTTTLRFGGANILDFNSAQPYLTLRNSVAEAVSDTMRGSRPAAGNAASC